MKESGIKQSKNYSKFLLLWSGELISSIGGGLTNFGLGIYIFQKTGSAAGMAFLSLIGFLPMLLFRVPAGVLADRYDRRILMMIGDGCSGVGVLFILLSMLRGEAAMWQIYLGVAISSCFSALMDPSFTATVTDLLTKEEYSRANGLVSIAGSSRFLFSPLIAGLLLTVSDIKLLLIIDICTFFVTIITTAYVRNGLTSKASEEKVPFLSSMKEGWRAIRSKEGLFLLILISAAITLFLGVFQILAEPFILSFADSKVLGIAETVCASGMLVSGVFLGVKGIKKNYVKILSVALMLSGIFVSGFAVFENIVLICLFGFLFFMALPFANNCLDYLARTNIPDELQGRAWGFIGFISQMGYVIAYALSGVLADGIGSVTGRGVGTGSAIVIIISGICMAVISFSVMFMDKIRRLEC
ncbi:Major Facilitator Superfamily protein [Lachnospiraceae bacterium]|nr:Major Facilitator Superfamily protein [Lachnospiraceae bacterium]